MLKHTEKIEVISGKKSQFISPDELKERIEGYLNVHLDLGTGDGAFAYRTAKSNPDSFLVGVDMVRANLETYSAKALKKPQKGGIPNVVFICCPADKMPHAFASLFDQININFPWSNLMRELVIPEPELISEIARVLKSGGEGEIYFNYHIFKGGESREIFELPDLDEDYVKATLIPEYAKNGLEITGFNFLQPDEVSVPSTWAGRLLKNSKRETLKINFRKSSEQVAVDKT